MAEHSRANIMVVEDEEQREKVGFRKIQDIFLNFFKIDTVWDRLPELQAVVQYTGNPTAPGVKSWKALLELGKVKMFPILMEIFRLSQAQDDSILMERLEAQADDEVLT